MGIEYINEEEIVECDNCKKIQNMVCITWLINLKVKHYIYQKNILFIEKNVGKVLYKIFTVFIKIIVLQNQYVLVVQVI